MSPVASSTVVDGVAPDVLRRTMGRFTTGVALVLVDAGDGSREELE